jgi:hypothetical protein
LSGLERTVGGLSFDTIEKKYRGPKKWATRFFQRKKYVGGYKSGILGKILGKIQVHLSPSLPLNSID